MVKQWACAALVVCVAVVLGGCATTGKQRELEMQGLRNQVSALETQLASRDDEVANLKDALSRANQELLDKEVPAEPAVEKRVIPEAKSRPTVKQVQIALKNAGYSPGTVDGRMGRQTRDAIRSFQKDNGLAADGKVGKRTWNILRKYLYKKVK